MTPQVTVKNPGCKWTARVTELATKADADSCPRTGRVIPAGAARSCECPHRVGLSGFARRMALAGKARRHHHHEARHPASLDRGEWSLVAGGRRRDREDGPTDAVTTQRGVTPSNEMRLARSAIAGGRGPRTRPRCSPAKREPDHSTLLMWGTKRPEDICSNDLKV